MTETLYIKGFGGLKEATYQISKQLTVIIGPEASGKSVTAKLLYFFKTSMHDAMLIQNRIQNGCPLSYTERVCDEFCHFFPQEYWGEEDFDIIYTTGNLEFRMCGNKVNGCNAVYPSSVVDLAEMFIQKIAEQTENEDIPVIDYLAEYNKELEKLGINRNSQVYVIASRSILAVQPDLTMQLATSSPNTLDPVSKGFIKLYPVLKRMQKRQKDEMLMNMTDKILRAKYTDVGGREYLQYSDNRQVDVSSVSSGQQEVLPLVLIFRALPQLVDSQGRVTLYIEEPETHLYPASQKAIVEVIAYLTNMLKNKLQIIVTTHSPYVLASFNNLLQASDSVKNGAEASTVDAILPSVCHLAYDDILTYSVHDGIVTNLMDEEVRLIGTTDLDEVSEMISNEFSKLLDA